MTDTITTEIIRHALLGAAEEVSRNLCRTAYNTVVYEIHDYGIGLHDHNGDVVADAPGIAIFTGANDVGIKHSLEYLGAANILPGDIFIINYPYWSSAHTLDPLVFAPIHAGDVLIGFASCRVHVTDLHQKDPGYVLDSTHRSQEGLVFPAARLYKQGIRNDDVFNIIRFNSRAPKGTIGDIEAQVSAVYTGVRRVNEIAERFGVENLRAAMAEIHEHGERIAREALKALPKGSWQAVDYVDDDGINRDQLVTLCCTVTVTADEMIVDWTGSAENVEGPINLPLGETLALSSLIFKSVTTPDSPVVAGNFRPLKVVTVAGSVVHAVSPMPTFTLWTGMLACEVILKALAQGMPDRIPACSGGDVCSMMGLGTKSNGEAWNEATNDAIGFGATAHHDGEDGIMHMSEPGCRNNPVEVLETKSSMMIDHYAYRPDSGGAGRFRGGVGISRAYRFTAPSIGICIVYKTKTQPWSVAGGHEGDPNHVILNPGTDREITQGGSYNFLDPGDVLVNATGGGGGHGSPLERDPEQVLRDVVNGFISIRSAFRDYGVAITDHLKIDWAETNRPSA